MGILANTVLNVKRNDIEVILRYLKSICLKKARLAESKLTEISKKVLKIRNKYVIVFVVKTLLGISNYFRVIIKVSSQGVLTMFI